MKGSDNPFPSVLVAEQGSAPATPASGYGRIYCKSDGLYFIDDDGVETGPLGVGGGGYPTFSGCVLTKSAVQAVATGSDTAITFNGEVYDTDDYHDNSTNPSRLTAPATGYYMVGGSAEIDGLGDGQYAIWQIRKGGSTANGDGRARLSHVRSATANAALPSLHFSRVVQLNAGEYVELVVAHNYGGDRNVRESSNGTSFWIYRVG